MNNISSNDKADELCSCGRDKDRRHCPYCGHINFYALKQRTKRPHPMTGDMKEISTFRCRSCNTLFDDLQRQFDCKAPHSLRYLQREFREATKETILRQAESGIKFGENDRRHFRRVVGMTYDDYMHMWRMTQKQKAQALERQVNKLKFAQPGVDRPAKLSPYQWHIENCNYCNSHAEDCDVARQLKEAEKMENQP